VGVVGALLALLVSLVVGTWVVQRLRRTRQDALLAELSDHRASEDGRIVHNLLSHIANPEKVGLQVAQDPEAPVDSKASDSRPRQSSRLRAESEMNPDGMRSRGQSMAVYQDATSSGGGESTIEVVLESERRKYPRKSLLTSPLARRFSAEIHEKKIARRPILAGGRSNEQLAVAEAEAKAAAAASMEAKAKAEEALAAAGLSMSVKV
jgi:hypothetical protein